MYTKIVTTREVEITRLAHELDIGAKLLCSDPCSIHGDLDKLSEQDYRMIDSLHWYYITLDSLEKVDRITYNEFNELMTMFNTLYENNIVYFDVHYNNIMRDPTTNNIKIIDYGHAMYLDDVLEDPTLIPSWFPYEIFSRENLMDYIRGELAIYIRN